MGRPPAVVIIARHGARLDAADKQWHLTSATPYDPPLTYGGWLQARALGARIAGILHTREAVAQDQHRSATINGRGNGEHVDPDDHTSHPPRGRKRHKIIIHSSPFVRCIQTSIAISAGIGQFRKTSASIILRHGHHVLQPGPPHVNTSRLSEISEPDESPPAPSIFVPMRHEPPTKHRISELRVDAFLGEWLSPDYFDQIMPPPSSVMMVASAKAELLRPGENVEGAEKILPRAQGNFPGGWRADWSPASAIDEEERTALPNLPSLSHRHRASTAGDLGVSGRIGARPLPKISQGAEPESLNYFPPTPTYAISSSEPIPVGYVAHARDACVDVKYQWDSMRPPQDWGNGGEYGEEWSSMHRRFRNGLQRMIAWYEENGTSLVKRDEQFMEEEDPDEDTVLILVTHGAGCNALIGALTNQPVLLDIGMASLTMAVRKENVGDVRPLQLPSPRKSRRGSIDLGIADEYDMKIISSTEHLRAASTPLTQSPRQGAISFSPHRRPPPSTQASFTEAFNLGEAPFGKSLTNAALLHNNHLEAHHRSASGPAGVRPFIPNSGPRVASGLWRTGTWNSSDDVSDSGKSDSMPNFDQEVPTAGLGTSAATESAVSNSAPRADPPVGIANGENGIYDHDFDLQRAATWGTTQTGLWQGGSFASQRHTPSPRRWTVIEDV